MAKKRTVIQKIRRGALDLARRYDPVSPRFKLDTSPGYFSPAGSHARFAFPEGWYSHQNSSLRKFGVYGAATSELLASEFPDGGDFVNVGCSFGWHLINICQSKSVSNAFLFDMNPLVMPVLAYNCAQLDNLSSYTLYPFGLTSRESSLLSYNIHLDRMAVSSIASPVDRGNTPSLTTYGGLMNPSDFEFIDRVDWHNALVLIDVEGAELDSLSALWETISAARPRIVMELNEKLSTEDSAELFHRFKDIGYCFYAIRPTGRVEMKTVEDWQAKREGRLDCGDKRHFRDVFMTPW